MTNSVRLSSISRFRMRESHHEEFPFEDPPKHLEWPSRGALVFDTVSFRYKDGDKLVLRDLLFTIESDQKIDIVGRTGAGKSSITMILFRIHKLASNTICIDGINTSTIGLKTLRAKLSMIPQNPVLLNEYSDDDLWRSIQHVGLSDRIRNDKKKLE